MIKALKYTNLWDVIHVRKKEAPAIYFTNQRIHNLCLVTMTILRNRLLQQRAFDIFFRVKHTVTYLPTQTPLREILFRKKNERSLSNVFQPVSGYSPPPTLAKISAQLDGNQEAEADISRNLTNNEDISKITHLYSYMNSIIGNKSKIETTWYTSSYLPAHIQNIIESLGDPIRIFSKYLCRLLACVYYCTCFLLYIRHGNEKFRGELGKTNTFSINWRISVISTKKRFFLNFTQEIRSTKNSR